MAEAPAPAKKSFYGMLEDKWYAFVDWAVQKLHVPLDKFFVNPLEDHGIPSLPVAIAIVVALIGGIGFMLLGGAAPAAVTFSVTVTAEGEPVDGAKVTLSYEGEKFEAETINGIAEFENVPTDKQVSVTVEKEGFEKVTKRTKPTDKAFSIRLQPAVESEEERLKKALRDAGVEESQLRGMSLTDAQKLAERMGIGVATGEITSMHVQVETPAGEPVSEASVVYEGGTVSDAATTGSDGKALINVPAGARVNAAASKDGYETKSKTFPARADATEKIILRQQRTTQARAGDSGVPGPDDAVRYATVIVRVNGRDPATEEPVDVANATVTLFTEDNQRINSTNASSASPAELRAPVGERVYASVEAPGFATKSSGLKMVEQARTTTIAVFLDQARCRHCPDGTFDEEGNVDALTINVKSQTGRPVSGARVFLYDSEGRQLLSNQTTSSNGSAVFSDLSVGTTVIAVALQANYVTNVSRELEVGEDLNHTLTLVASTDNNSARIDATVTDFDGDAVAEAYVTIALDDYLPLPGVYTDARGRATLADLPVGRNAVIMASKADFEHKLPSRVLTPGRHSETLVLLPPPVAVTFKAFDRHTGADISSATPFFAVYLGSVSTQAIANCTQTNESGCQMRLLAGIEYALRVTASGYISKTGSYEPPKVESTSYSANLSQTSAAMIEVTGLYGYDEERRAWDSTSLASYADAAKKISFVDGLPPSGPAETPAPDGIPSIAEEIRPDVLHGTRALAVGEAYYLEFRLYAPEGATEAGFYFQAGDKTSVLADDAAILRSLDWEVDEDSVFAEARGAVTSTRGFTTTSCGASESSNGLYKTVFVRIENDGSANEYTLRVPFFVTSRARPSGVTFSYSSYAVMPEGVMRSPFDSALETSATPSGKWCKTAAHNITYDVEFPGETEHTFHCGLQACIDVSYEQEGGAPQGGTGYSALVPLDPSQNPLAVNYKVADFNLGNEENPTPLKITITPEKMQLEQYDPDTRDQYTINVSARNPPRQESIVAHALASGVADVFFDYGEKFAQLQSYLLTYGEVHATLGNTYYLSYEDEQLVLKIKNADGELVPPTDSSITGEWSHATNDADANTILFFTDPIMPGDAVYVRLDYDSLPPECRDTEIVAMPLPNCFEYDSTKQLLRFDASASNTFGRECPLYNVDPNQVNEYQGQIRFNVFCLGITAQPYNLKVIKNPASVAMPEGTKPAWQVPAVYKSDVSTMGYEQLSGSTAGVYALLNNKQLGSLDNPFLSFNGILHDVRDKVTEPGAYVYVVNEGMEQMLLLGSSNVTIQDQHTELNRRHVSEILSKTVFRRKDERPAATAAEKGFPYSAFSTRPIKYSWASLRLSSTNDREDPDFVVNYDQVNDCFEQENHGVFLKSLRPRDNAWSQGLVAWEATAEAAKLTNTQYLQSVEEGEENVCGLKHPDAPEITTTLCGTSYVTCGGGCIVPLPIKAGTLELSTSNIRLMPADGRLAKSRWDTESERASDALYAEGEGVSTQVGGGDVWGKVYSTIVQQGTFTLHMPSCNFFEYWKNIMFLNEACEGGEDSVNYASLWTFVNAFTKNVTYVARRPHYSYAYCDEGCGQQVCISDLERFLNERDVTDYVDSNEAVSHYDVYIYEVPSLIPNKNLVIGAKALFNDIGGTEDEHHYLKCDCAYTKGNQSACYFDEVCPDFQ
ncbi:MAG: carboxypeptidase-like regulatory domain-containing protein [Candidatus Micrarchaeota archaeon]